MKQSKGVHIFSEFYGCKCDSNMLISISDMLSLMRKTIIGCGLTPLESACHQFLNTDGENDGYSFVIILQESHFGLNVHTWPGEKYENSCEIDIYVCNYSSDNTKKAEHLADSIKSILKPEKIKVKKFSV